MSSTTTDHSDDLEELLGALDLSSEPKITARGLPPPNKAFQKALESSEFSIFEAIADCGYFGWKPKGPYKRMDDVDSDSEITKMIDVAMKPERIDNIARINRSLPKTFEKLPAQTHKNSYPYSHPYIASLHMAAKHRGVDLNDVDFIFGGSTLGFLATNGMANKEANYLATVVPGTKLIMVAKISEYEQDYSAPGFQFERLVTGKKFSDRHELRLVEHMHLMKVGKYQVLFTGEADASDENDNPVEVSTSNPRWWKTQKMFQMISSGSIKFCAGSKRRDTLTEIRMLSLSEVAQQALVGESVTQLEQNITRNMEELVKSLEELDCDTPKKISFGGRRNGLSLAPVQGSVLLPPGSVVKDLLKK